MIVFGKDDSLREWDESFRDGWIPCRDWKREDGRKGKKLRSWEERKFRKHIVQGWKKNDQIFLSLARPGSNTAKNFLSLIPWLSIRIMISSPSRFRAFPGKRIRITPSIFSPCANTHSPKSLSSVKSIRASLIACSRTCWSEAEGKDSATDNTSYSADRSFLTIKKSQLSSARKVSSCNLSTRF